jgi:cytochrome bd-type quinol oxidase subunit 2
MTIPEDLDDFLVEESEKPKPRRRLDLAYACFAFLGLAVMAFASITFTENQNQAGYGMLSLTLVPPTLVAFVAGIVLTVKSWRHRPLVVLSFATLLFVGVLVGAGISDCCSEGASAKAIGPHRGSTGRSPYS